MTATAMRSAELIEREVARTDSSLVLIDGRAGSGKTTIAKHLRNLTEWQLVGLDECYPGWDGLSEGADMIAREILTEHRFTTFDWTVMEPGPVRTLDRAQGLIVEGCGAITPEAIAVARRLGTNVRRVWVECDAPERKARAFDRDGDIFRPHWDAWAQQELTHLNKNDPLGYAQIVIHTSQS